MFATLRHWSACHPRLWLVLVVGTACAFKAKFFLMLLAAPVGHPPDCYQDWASAKNFLAGAPVYRQHRESIPEWLGVSPHKTRYLIEVNAHPPPSVLVALPLTLFNFETTNLLWSLLSLAALAGAATLIRRRLFDPGPFWTPLLAAGVICSFPFYEEIKQGQWTCFLLLLLTCSCLALRNGQLGRAGAWAGLAAALKLFPAALFLHFVFARRWRSVAAGGAVLLAATVAAAVVLGPSAYVDYVTKVLPQVGEWRSTPGNHSLPAFWCKLLDAGTKSSGPALLAQAPWAARLGAGLSCGAILALVAFAAHRSRTPAQRDSAFALAVIAMTIASPTSWAYYSLLLLLPGALLWPQLPATGRRRGLFCLLAMFLLADMSWAIIGRSAFWWSLPVQSLVIGARLGFFALGWSVWRLGGAPAIESAAFRPGQAIRVSPANYRWAGRLAVAGFAALLTVAALAAADRLFLASLVPCQHLLPPQTRFVYSCSEFSCTATTNSLGMRDGAVGPKRAGVCRILCIGDSFTFGWGVELEQAWVKRLAEGFRADGVAVEVLNAGKPGAGPADYALVAVELIPRLKPDLVLVGVLQGDDLSQSNGRIAADGSRERRRPTRLAASCAAAVCPNLLAWRNANAVRHVGTPDEFTAHWRTLAKEGLARLTPAERGRFDKLDAEVRRRYLDGDLSPALVTGGVTKPDWAALTITPDSPKALVHTATMAKNLKRVRAVAAAHQSLALVVSIPDSVYAQESVLAVRRRLGYEVDAAFLTSEAPDETIRRAAAQAGMKLLSVTAAFREAAAGHPLYFEWDGHFNSEGHLRFAELCCPVLKAEVAAVKCLPRNQIAAASEITSSP